MSDEDLKTRQGGGERCLVKGRATVLGIMKLWDVWQKPHRKRTDQNNRQPVSKICLEPTRKDTN